MAREHNDQDDDDDDDDDLLCVPDEQQEVLGYKINIDLSKSQHEVLVNDNNQKDNNFANGGPLNTENQQQLSSETEDLINHYEALKIDQIDSIHLKLQHTDSNNCSEN